MVELLRKAIAWQSNLESGEAASQAEFARREGLTRARVTQVMGMLRLPPEIQQYVLSMPEMVDRPIVTERLLRPISQQRKPKGSPDNSMIWLMTRGSVEGADPYPQRLPGLVLAGTPPLTPITGSQAERIRELERLVASRRIKPPRDAHGVPTLRQSQQGSS